MSLNTKECNACHEVKSFEDFYKGRGKCRLCKAQYNKERRAKLKAANSALTMEELWARTPQKKCGQCKEILSSIEFSRCNSTKSGLQNFCRSCDNTVSSAARTRYIEQNQSLSLADLRELTLEKNCWSCEQTLPSTEFNRDNSRYSGLTSKCRDCSSDLNSEWAKNNPEKKSEINARYRAKKKGLFWEDMALEQILERDGLGCSWCGVIPDAYHIDHVRPLDLQGIHMPENLVASCPPCNTSKRATDPSTWLAQCLSQGITGIPSPSALEAVRLAFSGVHEELKAQIDKRNNLALAA